VATAVLVALAAIGYVVMRLTGADTSGLPFAGKPSATPLARVDLSGLALPRTSPCTQVEKLGVESALGSAVTASEHYAPGDRVQLGPGLRDVAQEFGCSYRSSTGAEARVWLFSQPVSRGDAARVLGQVRTAKGCRALQGGPVFGSPTTTTSCLVGRTRTVAMRGLFGNAWLTCELTVPPGGGGSDPVRRTQRWCVGVATALGRSG
jgi:hypothetical protein